MCTVTFIRSGNRFLVTSNRDERTFRRQALPPQFYSINNTRLLFPKDADAGGTWIAMKANGNIAVLLNGGFIKHTATPPYAKSRGLIFLDLFQLDHAFQAFQQVDLTNIEPFTIIIFEEEHLYECRWDGNEKHGRKLDIHKAHIWSSVTLYDDEVISKREHWFMNWLSKNPDPSQDDVLHFHQFAGDGDERNDLLMNRDGIYYTVSVTGIELQPGTGRMKYIDMKDSKTYEEQVSFTSTVAQ